jgi:hypothetical protein
VRSSSVISVSRHITGANYKSLTCSDVVSEDRHAPYVHDRHRADHEVRDYCWRCAMTGGHTWSSGGLPRTVVAVWRVAPYEHAYALAGAL